MWSQLSEDVQAWDSKPENKDTYAAVLNIIELLQDKADEAHLSAAAKGLLPVLEAAIVADRIPPEHLPAARRALERFQAVHARARQAEAEAKAAEVARLTLASDRAAQALLAEEELEAQARQRPKKLTLTLTLTHTLTLALTLTRRASGRGS